MASPFESDPHGHRADTPGHFSRQAWWRILKRVYNSLDTKNVSIVSAGIAFYGMLSIFPALAALAAIYGLLSQPSTVQNQINALHGLVPAEAQHLLATYLTSIVSSNSSRLGIGLIVSVAFALWSVRAATVSLIEALNIVYEEKEKRGLIRFQLVAVALTIGAVVFAVVALLVIAAIPAVMQLFGVNGKTEIIGFVIPWLILVVLMSVALAATYRVAPSRRQAKWRWVSWGSVAATILWVTASAGFSIFVAKFGNYDKTFGSLGAVVILLTWLYLSAYVALLGACLDAEMERQTARDSTEGPEKPIGRRGAKMADTVAD